MKLIPFSITKPKINKRILIGAAIVVLFLVAVAGYIWLQRTGKIPEFNLGLFLGKLTAGLTRKEAPTKTEEELVPEELEITLSSTNKVYEETAQTGEGITHLARKALKEYLQEKGQSLNLSAEHKIYIEDYIQNQTGDRWLDPGETVAISEDLITEAINESQQLTSEQLENLKQYSASVTF